MKLSKGTLVGMLCVIAVAATFLQFAPPPPPPVWPNQADYERFPPIPIDYWVQLLPAPLRDSSNIIMRIHYVSDAALPDTIDVYKGSRTYIFHDDGIGPDSTRHDGIYA